MRGSEGRMPIFLSTWAQGQAANEEAAAVYAAGGSLIDAIERGINVVENDPEVDSVGLGGLPNAEGEVELDAAIMDGTSHRAGAVCNLRNIANAISVARRVMDKTRHTTLAGDGAVRFALAEGFKWAHLLTPPRREAWLRWLESSARDGFHMGHDTIGMLGLDSDGHVAAGCSTSGLAWRIPGRVADSALIGSGLYADDNAGAASATGDGDVIMNYCTSFHIVMLMAEGMHPQAACEAALTHMVRSDTSVASKPIGVIALNVRSEFGAAAMNTENDFHYWLWRDGKNEATRAPILHAHV